MPEDAVVKRFFAAKGFGFIEADGGEELFVHQSQIQTEGFRKLITGQKVSFTRAEVDGKSQATKVTVTGEAPPRPPKEKKEGDAAAPKKEKKPKAAKAPKENGAAADGEAPKERKPKVMKPPSCLLHLTNFSGKTIKVERGEDRELNRLPVLWSQCCAYKKPTDPGFGRRQVVITPTHLAAASPEWTVYYVSQEAGRTEGHVFHKLILQPSKSKAPEMATATVGSVKIDASEKRLPAELIEMISTKCEWGPDKKVHMHVGILIDSITVESPPSAEKAAAEETADA